MRDWPLDYEAPAVSKKPRKYPIITSYMHERIKRLYLNKVECSGEVAEFAKAHGFPRWKISRYAQNMGWAAKQKKEPNWCQAELGILKTSGKHCNEVIQRHLRKAGYQRSIAGIALKRRRMRIASNLKGNSAQAAALCLGEDVHFVLRAIHKGLLKAERRQQNRLPVQGGNAFLIKDKDLRQFVIENIHMIDIRKVDKYWFVDLLTEGKIEP